MANGLKVPGEQKSKYDEYRQREIEYEESLKKAEYERFGVTAVITFPACPASDIALNNNDYLHRSKDHAA